MWFNCFRVHAPLANRLHVWQNYDYLYKINNCSIVGGASYLLLQALWVGCLCICRWNKQSWQSKTSELMFRLERTKHYLVFSLLIAYVYVHYWSLFSCWTRNKHPICMHGGIYQEWYWLSCPCTVASVRIHQVQSMVYDLDCRGSWKVSVAVLLAKNC